MTKNEFEQCDNHLIHNDLVRKSREFLLDDVAALKISNFVKVLGDPTRIKIINLLHQQELCVCDLVELLQMNQPAVSQQLKTLKHAQIVKFRRSGHNVFYTLDDDCVERILNDVKKHVLEH